MSRILSCMVPYSRELMGPTMTSERKKIIDGYWSSRGAKCTTHVQPILGIIWAGEKWFFLSFKYQTLQEECCALANGHWTAREARTTCGGWRTAPGAEQSCAAQNILVPAYFYFFRIFPTVGSWCCARQLCILNIPTRCQSRPPFLQPVWPPLGGLVV